MSAPEETPRRPRSPPPGRPSGAGSRVERLWLIRGGAGRLVQRVGDGRSRRRGRCRARSRRTGRTGRRWLWLCLCRCRCWCWCWCGRVGRSDGEGGSHLEPERAVRHGGVGLEHDGALEVPEQVPGLAGRAWVVGDDRLRGTGRGGSARAGADLISESAQPRGDGARRLTGGARQGRPRSRHGIERQSECGGQPTPSLPVPASSTHEVPSGSSSSRL